MGKKVKRELGLQECFPLPMSHGEAQARGTPHYYTAELLPSSLPEASPFTVGDNHTYNGYWNSPLDPRKSYLIYFQAMSNFRGVSDCKTPTSVAADLAVLHQLEVDISIQDNSKPALSGLNECLYLLMPRLVPWDSWHCLSSQGLKEYLSCEWVCLMKTYWAGSVTTWKWYMFLSSCFDSLQTKHVWNRELLACSTHS